EPTLNWMTSAAAVPLASRMAWRSEPGPASLALVTVKKAGRRRSSRDSRFNRTAVRRDRPRAAREADRHDFSQERGEKRVMRKLLRKWVIVRHGRAVAGTHSCRCKKIKNRHQRGEGRGLALFPFGAVVRRLARRLPRNQGRRRCPRPFPCRTCSGGGRDSGRLRRSRDCRRGWGRGPPPRRP